MISKQEIQKLPNLLQVIGTLKKNTKTWVTNGGWENYTSPIFSFSEPGTPFSPFCDFKNEAPPESFVIVKTAFGRHVLKPNLRETPFLFRGQNKKYDRIISGFSRNIVLKEDGTADRDKTIEKNIISNLLAEEFIDTLRTHPLFMMLDRGIILEPEKKPLFINMNYYGLAQHYNFKTGVIDFTTDIDVAAFFACTENKGFDEYSPITDTNKYPYGVLYIHEIVPEATFKTLPFTTIGLQLYPRSGAQKGILFNEEKGDVDKMVKPILFKHNPYVSQHFYELQDGGKQLFPNDSIAEYAKEILNKKTICGSVFARNLFSNQDNFERNYQAVANQGYSIDWNAEPYFNDSMIDEVYKDIKNGLWEDFCSHIYITDGEKGKLMHESLLQLPQNPAYKHYFNKDKYYTIIHYEYDRQLRAMRN